VMNAAVHGEHVEVAARPLWDGGVEILVDDNGPGIAAADRERIFDPYVTTKEHGTGLGLAIVRKVIIDHGGDVTATQAPPPLSGARLRVELPQSPAGVRRTPATSLPMA